MTPPSRWVFLSTLLGWALGVPTLNEDACVAVCRALDRFPDRGYDPRGLLRFQSCERHVRGRGFFGYCLSPCPDDPGRYRFNGPFCTILRAKFVARKCDCSKSNDPEPDRDTREGGERFATAGFDENPYQYIVERYDDFVREYFTTRSSDDSLVDKIGGREKGFGQFRGMQPSDRSDEYGRAEKFEHSDGLDGTFEVFGEESGEQQGSFEGKLGNADGPVDDSRKVEAWRTIPASPVRYLNAKVRSAAASMTESSEDPVDWDMWCVAQCDNGHGGSACNCDIIP